MMPQSGQQAGASRKRKKLKKPSRMPSIQYPSRLKEVDDSQDDAAAVHKEQNQYMNQSVFSMIAAAGSKAEFNNAFNEVSSESEDDEHPGEHRMLETSLTPAAKVSSPEAVKALDASNALLSKGKFSAESAPEFSPPKADSETDGEKDPMTQSTILPAETTVPVREPTQAPQDGNPQDGKVSTYDEEDTRAAVPKQDSLPEGTGTADSDGKLANLETRLKEMFHFVQPESVVAEYPCWLMQSVFLQGYLYITKNHISFYAYLPKKSNVIMKSGYLSKKGRQNPKYRRYWFSLKGDVLSYFADQSDRYFPSGTIDLRYAISAALSGHKEKAKDIKDFSITTHQRTHHFKADTPASAKEWVRTCQKVIFRSHNDGDSVKISLPIENIIDVEQSPVTDLADTVKIRVVDNDETYAIDEYYFTFFSLGKEAFEALNSTVEGSAAKQIPKKLLTPSSTPDRGRSRNPSPHPALRLSTEEHTTDPSQLSHVALKEQVRATLSPSSPLGSGPGSPMIGPDRQRSSARSSVEIGRKSFDLSRASSDFPRRDFSRSNFDRPHKSAGASREQSRKPRDDGLLHSPLGHASTDSLAHSNDTKSHSPTGESDDVGNQLLQKSDVFQPMAPEELGETPDQSSSSRRRRSHESLHSKGPSRVEVHPPSRAQSDQSIRTLHHNIDAAAEARTGSRSPAMQQLVKVGGYPLHKAAGLAGFFRRRSKKMGSTLASESLGYVDKVSDMWAGDPKHFNEADERPDSPFENPEQSVDAVNHGDRFRAHFSLPEGQKLQATYYAYLHRVLPLYGKIYISSKYFCFRSLLPGTKTKLLLPLKDVENLDKEKGFRFGYHGLVVVIRGHEELFFEFTQQSIRDDCAITVLKNLSKLGPSDSFLQEDKEEAEAAKAEHHALLQAREDVRTSHEASPAQHAESADQSSATAPILFDDPRASILNFKPTESLRITCLTIGSRGDVQPYIALCKGLLKEGQRPRIATHLEFEPWIRKHGIDFAPVEGDPAKLMALCVEYGVFTYSFLKEASSKFRGWIDGLLDSAWKACQDTDILIESPSAMAGIHIAEALEIPYFRAFTMPWTRTRAYPHAFAVPEHKMGGAYNYLTYIMFDNVFWKAIAGQVNRWRKKELGLRATSLDRMQPNKVPFLYNFSPSVVIPPLDFSDWIRVTGYWFLDEGLDWSPPEEMSSFIAKARQDEKKIVYIGFGSIVVSDPTALTKTVIESVLKADVRAILSKGWSDRLGSQNSNVAEVPLPPEILQIKSAPHDWLFNQIDAAVHHGGAGTTGASLRAGIPTIIKPFFGDQFFFGSRVEDLGVGICLKKLNVSRFSRALWESTHSQRMIDKARMLGEQIRSEDGVETAIQAIYRDLEYAKSLIKHRKDLLGDGEGADLANIEEETWTFIGDESDPELQRKIREWEPPTHELLAKKARESLDLGA